MSTEALSKQEGPIVCPQQTFGPSFFVRALSTYYKKTVAVSTEMNFFQLLMRPLGSQGCQKMRLYLLNMNLTSVDAGASFDTPGVPEALNT